MSNPSNAQDWSKGITKYMRCASLTCNTALSETAKKSAAQKSTALKIFKRMNDAELWSVILELRNCADGYSTEPKKTILRYVRRRRRPHCAHRRSSSLTAIGNNIVTVYAGWVHGGNMTLPFCKTAKMRGKRKWKSFTNEAECVTHARARNAAESNAFSATTDDRRTRELPKRLKSFSLSFYPRSIYLLSELRHRQNTPKKNDEKYGLR